jgi:hypothetical protein
MLLNKDNNNKDMADSIQRPDNEKLYFPGYEAFSLLVNLVALPILVGLLTNFISERMINRKSSSTDLQIDSIRNKLNELQLTLSENWPNEIDFKKVKQEKYLKDEIAKFLESRGWTKDLAESDARLLAAKIKNRILDETFES